MLQLLCEVFWYQFVMVLFTPNQFRRGTAIFGPLLANEVCLHILFHCIVNSCLTRMNKQRCIAHPAIAWKKPDHTTAAHQVLIKPEAWTDGRWWVPLQLSTCFNMFQLAQTPLILQIYECAKLAERYDLLALKQCPEGLLAELPWSQFATQKCQKSFFKVNRGEKKHYINKNNLIGKKTDINP